ncbi:nitro/flavin reductase [Bacillus sp. NRRL B-14911]|uniref:FMN reductase n=1 Tax=Bacillus infantis NRRL B-14911 TaxID=1367477 RepID=U5L6U1_9BACI|nr:MULTISPECIES: oxygen-insensitive NADPH nitroreductase [Bacillus]AGX03125.1 FMN reductase [Bacillus infantis NRRL B-14911]EAR66611.1 nitro/flavin reductase [Bacillus sp. NRRL B-14911]
MNETVETILAHRSIRKFEERELTRKQVETIVSCAQAASSSSFIQAYTIIGITDPEKKQKLSELAGNQSYVAHNGHFFVFCADLNRHHVLSEMEGKDLSESLESTEKFMVAMIDAALAAQNATVAAESMGLGVCYIGGIRNQLEEAAKVLGTPERVIPLFGLSVGYPAQDPDKKPRLPLEHVYHENGYQQDHEKYKQQLEDYNQTVSAYYAERTQNMRKDTWTGQMAAMLEKPVRMYMKDFVNKNKLDLK